ncbi:MAG: hypothetical protein IJV80_06600 [Clostridia bacterium]|nr:hypothetical protein [Clostridia bacterium]
MAVVIPNSIVTIEKDAFYNFESTTIYCEAELKPSGWDAHWIGWDVGLFNPTCPVVWNCTENEVAGDGFIYTVVG